MMRNSFIALITIVFVLFVCLLNAPINQNGGDILEYYGITQSLMSHGGIDLNVADRHELSREFGTGLLEDPQYYLSSPNGGEYPVHFIAYSLLLFPVRLVLSAFGLPLRLMFGFTNLMLLSGVVWFIMRHILHDERKRWLLLVLVFASPLITFLMWPGADIYGVSLILLALFLLAAKHDDTAVMAAALASWQSQPLTMVAAGFALIAVIDRIQTKRHFWDIALGSSFVLVPTLYSLAIFNATSPWLLFEGKHEVTILNITAQKGIELLLDLNIGLIWYAPLISLAGLGMVVYSAAKKQWRMGVLLLTMIATALVYETNSNWHNGTAGYGPSRYALFMLPFAIWALVSYPFSTKIIIGLALLIVGTQAIALYPNRYVYPRFANTLEHSPQARFVLDRWPGVYNPTPEIFVERTLHAEPDRASSAVYMKDISCAKGFILQTDWERTQRICNSVISTSPEISGSYVTF